MKYVYSIALVSILMSKTIYSVFWQVNFVVHQKEITELECINKDRPEMNCNGNCYLAKQLQKADFELDQKKEESSKRLSQLKSLEGNDVFFFEILSFGPFSNAKEEKSTLHCRYTDSYHFEFQFTKFNPPCFLV
jgi:hypothetical protein